MEKSNPVIFISGATSGIGEATAKLFAKNGYDLIITGRRSDRLESLKTDLIDAFKVNVITLCFDVRNQNEVIANIGLIPEGWTNRLKIIINNAGLALGKSPIDEGLTEDWNQMIDTNVKGLLYVSKALIPFLKSNQSGHIINIGSIAGKEVYPDGNVYCATKHAVDALSRAMRMDLVSHNIKVTNIAPGAVETEFSLVRFKGNQKQSDAAYEGYQSLVAKDIAETIYFVSSRPMHVNINDLVIMPSAQASATVLNKKL
jgi:3-hydroxy acid dehydrogenase/malonic semialdehyde reductase